MLWQPHNNHRQAIHRDNETLVALNLGVAVYVVFLAGSCALALILGGRTERLVAVAFIVAAIATNLASALGSHWHGPNWGVIGVDLLFLVVLTIVACRSIRFWPIWTAASQLAGCLAHLPAILLPSLPMTIHLEP